MKKCKDMSLKGLTMLEMIISLAIIAVIFAVILPQFRNMQNSWASKRATAEAIQNGRILIDHLSRDLATAAKITAVSDPCNTTGYIEFEGNDGTTYRYDIAADNYVEFGPVGTLSDLAGPVSQLQFTCYDAQDLDTPITTPEDIRCVKVEVTLTNPGPGQDQTFTASAYLRTNAASSDIVIEGSHCEFDTAAGKTPALAKIDNSHYLCAYSESFWDDGWAVVLTVDTDAQTVTSGTPFKFDDDAGLTPALAKIDNTHYLCAYTGYQDDGWAVVLTVNPGTWTITKETPFEFDTESCWTPALAGIDSTHYLCAYRGMTQWGTGAAVVLTVNTGNWTITKEVPFEYTSTGTNPALSPIDAGHYLCAYRGSGGDAEAVVLTVNPATWTITNEVPRVFGVNGGSWPALSRMDPTNYLCAYTVSANTGWARLLRVNPVTWIITSRGAAFEFGPGKGKRPALAQIDSTSSLCVWDGVGDVGTGAILGVNTTTGAITKRGGNFEFAQKGMAPALCNVESRIFLGVYQGQGDDGWAVLFNTDNQMRP